MIQFTENEKAILRGAQNNDYGNCFAEEFEGCYKSSWVFAVIDSSGLNPKIARGAIASLAKKDIAIVADYEGKGRADDMTFELTNEGIKSGLEAIQ
jgi:hypothetical protein